jgi:hypothetical protein
MSKIQAYNLGSLQLKVSPFLHKRGEMVRALNIQRDSVGAWKKRPGYATYLGTPDNDQVTDLFSWLQNDGNTLYTYRKSGSILYYSTQGTDAWTVCGNGTLTEGGHVGHAVLDNTMIIGDGTAATRHTTSGTDFTNTTNAPLAEHFTQYQSRIWVGRGTAEEGTATDLIFSTTGTATDWTTDSSSIRIPGEGRISSVFTAGDRVIITKDSGNLFKYDGFSLVDLATDLGPTSPYSVGNIEDFRLYLNRRGVFGYGGVRPELTSLSIERQIYNDAGNGIAGTVFDNAPGVVHKYDYFVGVGTVVDDLINGTVADAVLKYDFQLDEWVNWKFANRPYAFHSYKDEDGVERMIFGDNGGQCYTLGGTDLNDNGSAIETAMEFIDHHGEPEYDKKYNYYWFFFNPGMQGKVQIAVTDTFTKRTKRWVDLGQARDGVIEGKFPAGTKGKLLNIRIYESSMESRFQFYGYAIDADSERKK